MWVTKISEWINEIQLFTLNYDCKENYNYIVLFINKKCQKTSFYFTCIHHCQLFSTAQNLWLLKSNFPWYINVKEMNLQQNTSVNVKWKPIII